MFLECQNQQEGFLSQKRAIIVARRHLNLIGQKIIPKEQIKSNFITPPSSVFGNTLEAIIGAIYLDKGIKQASIFVRKHIYKSDFINDLEDIDFKSKLLKYSQKKKIKIRYKTEKKEGPDHAKQFLVAVFINGKKIAAAKAGSKKEAEQKAAKKTINSLF